MRLENEMQKLPVSGMVTNYQVSYTGTSPYEDTSKHRRRTGAAQNPNSCSLDIDENGAETEASSGAKRPDP